PLECAPWESGYLGRLLGRRDACAPRRPHASQYLRARTCQLRAVEALASRTDVHQGLWPPGSQLRVKILALVVHHYERREILHLNTPDGFHAQLWIFDDVHLFDAMLGQPGRRTTNRPQ